MNNPGTVIVEAVIGEFSDLTDLGDLTRATVRLLLAAALGAWLGYNRERTGKSAGLRTHMLVAMGSALFVMVPLFAGMAMADLSRVIQGVVTGIGFLGAGTIIKHRDQEEVVGLTTAASIFMTSAIGIACGLGSDVTAIAGTLLAWLVLGVVQRLAGTKRRD
jgi:putative Mg2+ transporter-C (MgtC) family protein